jgi:hypothetical protein
VLVQPNTPAAVAAGVLAQLDKGVAMAALRNAAVATAAQFSRSLGDKRFASLIDAPSDRVARQAVVATPKVVTPIATNSNSRHIKEEGLLA